MELIIWQNYLNCINLNYWHVSFNKTEYYLAFNSSELDLFFCLNNDHLKFYNYLFYCSFLVDMYFQTADFFVLNSLTANIQNYKIQLPSIQDEEQNIKFNI